MGIAISGLPARIGAFNAVYRRTREQIDGHPCFASAADRHLFRHPALDRWHLTPNAYDPAASTCFAMVGAAGGPVPMGLGRIVALYYRSSTSYQIC